MSARTRTLQQLLDGVADRGDITIAASGTRHTTTLVTARINRAIQRWLLMVAEAGDDTNLLTSRVSTSTSSTRDAKNWAPYQYIAAPAGCQLIRGMDVWSNNTPIPMMPADESERDDTQLAAIWWANGVTGMPVFYRLGGTDASGAAIIQLFPWCNAVYTIDVRYIPAHVDLTQTTDVIDFIAGGEEWVINDVVLQSKVTDGLAGTADLSVIVGWNKKIEDELRFTLACRGHTRREDTVARRAMLRRMAVGGWRVPS